MNEQRHEKYQMLEKDQERGERNLKEAKFLKLREEAYLYLKQDLGLIAEVAKEEGVSFLEVFKKSKTWLALQRQLPEEKLNEIGPELVKFYDSKSGEIDLDNAVRLFDDSIREMFEQRPEIVRAAGTEKWKKAGDLEYHTVRIPDIELSEKEKTNPEDELIMIHLTRLIKEGKKLSSKGLRDSFKELIAGIERDHPRARAIVGISWLMDTPLARRLFHVSEPREGDVTEQGINYSQLSNKRALKHYLKTDELLYQPMWGAITIEDLKKFGQGNNRKQ